MKLDQVFCPLCDGTHVEIVWLRDPGRWYCLGCKQQFELIDLESKIAQLTDLMSILVALEIGYRRTEQSIREKQGVMIV